MSADLTCHACEGSGLDGYCRICAGTGRRRPHLSEWDALASERNRWRTKAEEEYDLAIETLNEVLANAGEEWDGDASIDSIAVSYVRWLEGERDRYRATLDGDA